MEIRILGSAGSEVPGQNPPAFVIDNFLLIDAGTIPYTLDKIALCDITHVCITHAHLDHIKALPFLLDNLAVVNPSCHLTVISGKEVISDIRKHIFNNRIWPDFTTIPTAQDPIMQYGIISANQTLEIGGYRILATPVNHTVPAYGYLITKDSGGALLYTGDTGPTEAIWKRMRGHDVRVLITEVSFPNDMSSHALTTGHLCPALLEEELLKMPKIPEKIFISHLKPAFREQIEAELERIRGVNLELLEEGKSLRVS